MNKVILMGRLTRDPEIHVAQSEQPLTIAMFTLAVDRRNRNSEQIADFITCKAFGKTAEFAEKYLAKGTKILIEGRWQTGSYKNKDGQTVYTNECIVDQMEFAESKKTETEEKPQTDADGFMKVADDDEGLPFV